MVRSQGNTRASQRTSKVVKKRENRNITPSLSLRLRRRLKVARLRPARGSSNVAPANAVNNSIARNILVEIDVVLAGDGGTVPVSWTPGPRVWRMGATRRGSGDGGTTGRPRGSSRCGGRGTRRRLGSAAMKGTAVGVMARGPAGAVGALINGTLIPIVPKTVTGMTSLMVARMGGWEGNL